MAPVTLERRPQPCRFVITACFPSVAAAVPSVAHSQWLISVRHAEHGKGDARRNEEQRLDGDLRRLGHVRAARRVQAHHHEHYNTVGIDRFFDHPLANGDGVSVQADGVHYHGVRTFSSLPPQETWLGELGYFSKATRLTPFIQVAALGFLVDSMPDQRQALAGLAWFVVGHGLNLKAAVGRLRRAGTPSASLFQLTLQSFEY
jgi:hypothetical protein